MTFLRKWFLRPFPSPKPLTSGSSSTKPVRRPKRFRLWTSDWTTDWWGIELACSAIAALSLAAIVIVLESHRGQPMPEWRFGITINSLLSIFATIGQMSMMKPVAECISQLKWLWFIRKQKLSGLQIFDNASRGPIGSLILFGKLRGIHLVSLGAIITILSAGFVTFSQQVVTYPLKLHLVGVANAPQVLTLTNELPELNSFAVRMQEAINQAFLVNTNFSAVTPSCSTGNCTWVEYPSLGVCASVLDISPTIQNHTCNKTAFEQVFESAGVKNPGFPCYNYTLPVSVINADYINNDDNEITNTIGSLSLSNAYVDTNDQLFQTGGMKNFVVAPSVTNASSITTTYILTQPGISTSNNSSLPKPIAYQLNLEFCIHTYNTTISNGAVNTTMVSSQILETYLETKFFQNNQHFGFQGHSSNWSISVENTIFSVQSGPLGLLIGQLMYSSSGCYIKNLKPSHLGDQNSVYCEGAYSTDFWDAISNSTEPLAAIKIVWQNVATSITNSFRMGAGGTAQLAQVSGGALAPVAFVDSNYYWLIFPVTLVVSTMIFLAATIRRTKILGSQTWKSSNFAILQGLDPDLHSKLGGLSSITEMEDKAEKLVVRLDINGQEAPFDAEYSCRLVESKQDKFWNT